jgi:hypothetical protein
MSLKHLIASGLFAIGLGIGGGAQAGAIISATGAVIDAGGPGFGPIADTFNKNGLLTGYTAGVTDFDTYIAGNPQHSLVFAGNEWFSNSAATAATVTYDLGSSKTIDALALWNEDISGIGSLALETSSDGLIFAPLVAGLLPTNNNDNFDYGADVFSFGAVTAQFVRFVMTNCPQVPNGPNPGGFGGCAIGEVAFRATAVPEPGILELTGLALLGLVLVRRRVR